MNCVGAPSVGHIGWIGAYVKMEVDYLLAAIPADIKRARTASANRTVVVEAWWAGLSPTTSGAEGSAHVIGSDPLLMCTLVHLLGACSHDLGFDH